MSGTLVAHVDSRRVDESILRAIVVPAPTATWRPVGHGELLDLVLPVFAAKGLQIGSKQFALSNDQAKMFGVFDVVNLDNADKTVSFAVGIRNSIDKTLPAGICFGARVFVCDNLAFSAEVTLQRRHTKNILDELPKMIDEKVSQFGMFRDSHYRLFDALKTVQLTADEVWGLIGKAFISGAIGKTKIADIWAELQNEAHIAKHGTSEYGGPMSAWSLYNAGTEVMKGRQNRNMIEAAGESINWHGIFTKFAPAPKILAVVPALPTATEVVAVTEVTLVSETVVQPAAPTPENAAS